jgi:hypothetical protein
MSKPIPVAAMRAIGRAMLVLLFTVFISLAPRAKDATNDAPARSLAAGNSPTKIGAAR